MLAMSQFGVLVNTCDTFDDCWEPFFTLWAKNGLGSTVPIYLNTERAEFRFQGLDVRSLHVCTPSAIHTGWTGKGRAPWSWCLRQALLAIPEDIVLYMQEDYFLDSRIDESALACILAKMNAHSEIECVHLTKAGIAQTEPSAHSELLRGLRRSRPFVSCQAALWRKSTLINLLRTHENGWQFERWGSRRARLMNCSFYVSAVPTLSYPFTGVIQGRWYPPVVQLFEQNGIKMDFSRRGFYNSSIFSPDNSIGKNSVVLFRHLIKSFTSHVTPVRSAGGLLRCIFVKKNPIA